MDAQWAASRSQAGTPSNRFIDLAQRRKDFQVSAEDLNIVMDAYAAMALVPMVQFSE